MPTPLQPRRYEWLADGGVILVRPIRADDKGRLAAAFERLSEESRTRRFLSPVKSLNAERLAYFTEVDHDEHVALVALDPGNRMVGVARYARDPRAPDVAEAAVVVIDDWQRRGVGSCLLRHLVDRARAGGVRAFRIVARADNRQAISLFAALGEERRIRSGDGLVELEIALPAEGGVGPELAQAMRAAAAGAFFETQTLFELWSARLDRPGP